jgi:peptidoglycan/LPS O-acetylase OafA/YrhL
MAQLRLFEADYPETAHLTGLRAYAALAVFSIHVGAGPLEELGWVVKKMVSAGANGVAVFYVLSAYSLTLSIQSRPRFSWRDYATARALRIYPLYVALIALFWVTPWTPSGWAATLNAPHDATSLFYHLTFLNVLDARYMVNALGTEWSIGVEVFYYALLPFLILSCRHWWGGVALLAIYLLLLKSVNWMPATVAAPHDGLNEYVRPQTYMVCFFGGVVAAEIWRRAPWLSRIGRVNDAIVALVITLFLVEVSTRQLTALANGLGLPHRADTIVYTTFTVLLAMFGGTGRLTGLLLRNRAAIFLGTISYSIYLWHFPADRALTQALPELGELDSMRSLAVLAVTLALSTLTFLLIERPGMALARRVRVARSGGAGSGGDGLKTVDVAKRSIAHGEDVGRYGPAQARLARAVDEREVRRIRRLGSERVEVVDGDDDVLQAPVLQPRQNVV